MFYTDKCMQYSGKHHSEYHSEFSNHFESGLLSITTSKQTAISSLPTLSISCCACLCDATTNGNCKCRRSYDTHYMFIWKRESNNYEITIKNIIRLYYNHTIFFFFFFCCYVVMLLMQLLLSKYLLLNDWLRWRNRLHVLTIFFFLICCHRRFRRR